MEQISHFAVVPFTEGNGELVIVLEWGLRVVNNECTTETVGVLAHVVRVIPVGSSLIRLFEKLVNALMPPSSPNPTNLKVILHVLAGRNWTLSH